MTLLLGNRTKVSVNDFDLSEYLTEATLYLDSANGWNLVLEGLFDNEKTMEWADTLKNQPVRVDGRVDYWVDFVWSPDKVSSREGTAILKNFKIISNVEEIMTFKLHLREIFWKKNVIKA